MKNLFFKKPYRELEKKLGYSFSNDSLLIEALTHPSRKNEEITSDNQRLEFLGDAVLSLLTSEYLYKEYPNYDEGALTTMRVQMINAKALVTIGELLEISKYLLLGKSERETGGEKKASNIADAVEAIIGAAYLDGKLNAARKIFEKVFVPNINLIPEDHFVDNFKGLLQTKVQKKLHVNPQYHLLETHGPPHAMEFVVEVRINEKVFGKGKGKTKREAEQQAAKEALAKFT